MKTKKMDTFSKDLISSLPDALICHILSFLSTKDAALTSSLSKRWKDQLKFVPNLDFDTSIYNHPETGEPQRKLIRRSFKVFVDRVMALQGNAPLNKFSLKCSIRSDHQSSVDGWISKVLARGVVHLDLYIGDEYEYMLPPKFLRSNTLVRLKFVGGPFVIPVEDVFLPKLKTLHLHYYVEFGYTGADFAKLISSCPVLEELVMIEVTWGYWDSCIVSNPTLKRLTIDCGNTAQTPGSVSFDTPNVVYLDYSDTVAVNYPIVNFDSLVEARLCLRMLFVGNAADFLMGISNVKILHLSSSTLEVLTFCCKAMPVFNNLIQLTIETDQEVGWQSLPNLLKNCPNLETLVFEELHYRDTKHCGDEIYRFKGTNECFEDEHRCVCKPWEGTPVWLSSSPVKILKVLKFGEITTYKDDMDKQMDLIKYFLETMPNLEQVILNCDMPIADPHNVSTELQMLEKVASPKCRIQVISDNNSFSSTVGSSSSTSGLVFFKNTFPV